MPSERNSDILSLSDTCPSRDVRQMLHSCNVILSLNLALHAYSLLLNTFNTNTPSGLCSRFKWGVHSKVLLAWFPAPSFACWLEHKKPTHTTDEEVSNTVSCYAGAAWRARATEALKSSAHQVKALLLLGRVQSIAAMTWGIAARHDPALNNVPCQREQLQVCRYIKWCPWNAHWVFWYSPLGKELNKMKFTDRAAVHEFNAPCK